jgi:hypothetical protein
MSQTTPLKGISPRALGKIGLRRFGLEDKILEDQKEMIEEMMESMLYASKVLDKKHEM